MILIEKKSAELERLWSKIKINSQIQIEPYRQYKRECVNDTNSQITESSSFTIIQSTILKHNIWIPNTDTIKQSVKRLCFIAMHE